jgi:uncharacterized protein
MSMLQEPEQQLDPRILKVWRFNALLFAVMLFLGASGAGIASWKLDWPWWIAAGFGALAVLVMWLTGYVLPQKAWAGWSYGIHEEEIDLLRGIFQRKRTLVPMVRVQHVDMKQGPIMRRYGLASITFSTAAGSHEIPGLDAETADEIRIRISGLAGLNHEDI